MKTIKRLISIAMALAIILSLSTLSASAAYTTAAQQALATAATILRNDLGRSDDDAAVRTLSDQWHYEAGTTKPDSRGYYYSGVDKSYHYYGSDSYATSYNSSNRYDTRWPQAVSGNNRQQAAYAALNEVTPYYKASSPVVVALTDVLASEYGENCRDSYLYSSRDNGYYYFGASAVSGNNRTGGGEYWFNGYRYAGQTSYVSTGYTYDWNGYRWFQFQGDTSQYFRIVNQQVIWATTWEASQLSRNAYLLASRYFITVADVMSSVTGANTSSNGNNTNGNTGNTGTTGTTTNSAYNANVFKTQNYYNGVFTGTEKYIDVNKATVLAKMMASYKRGDPDIRQVAAMGWSFMDLCGSKDYASCTSYYPDYDPNIATTDNYGRDLLALAKDLLFRKEAERNGVADVGRTLPKNYTWLWIDGDGVVYFRQSENGANYDFTNVKNPYNK